MVRYYNVFPKVMLILFLLSLLPMLPQFLLGNAGSPPLHVSLQVVTC